MKGATAYEFQLGRWHLRICHLRGAYWAGRPWRRVTLKRVPADSPVSVCDHLFVDGFGLMGDALTCCRCGLCKYPEALGLALDWARARGRVVWTDHPRWSAYAQLARRARRQRECIGEAD